LSFCDLLGSHHTLLGKFHNVNNRYLKKKYIPGSTGIYPSNAKSWFNWKSTNAIYHINMAKKKSFMNTSIDAEKCIRQNPHLFVKKVLRKAGIEHIFSIW
jgi:hypothetical protein